MVSVDVKPNVSLIPCELVWPSDKLGLIRFSSPCSSKIVVYGHCLVTLQTQLTKKKKKAHIAAHLNVVILVVTV